MKGKFKKIINKRNIIVVICVAIIAVMSLTSVNTYFSSKVGETKLGKASETISITVNSTTYEKDITINGAIVNTDEGNFAIEGMDIVKQAAKYLNGDPYSTGSWECSHLVQKAIGNAGITGIIGFKSHDEGTITSASLLPRQTMDYLCNSDDAAWDELEFWYYEDGEIKTRTYNASTGSNSIKNYYDANGKFNIQVCNRRYF